MYLLPSYSLAVRPEYPIALRTSRMKMNEKFFVHEQRSRTNGEVEERTAGELTGLRLRYV